MGETTAIQWTDSTFNPWRGCTKVSPGCAHCYAERKSLRFPALGVWGEHGTRVLTALASWREPRRWNKRASPLKPRLVFCASLADIFEDWQGQLSDHFGRPLWSMGDQAELSMSYPVSDLTQPPGATPYTLAHARKRLWQLIRMTPCLRWQLLTKRPENLAAMMPEGEWPNVWLGTSVESQAYTSRIDDLLGAPQKVPVRFVSAEPLLGSLLIAHRHLRQLQWVIVGGESGPDSRPFALDWAQDLVEECRQMSVACFVKQMGANPIEASDDGQARSLPLVDCRKGADINEWPAHLRVREMPFVHTQGG
jgi:protein gp37